MDRQLLETFIAQAEGRRSACYLDPVGIATIGVGVNLEETRNTARLARLGHDPAAVLAGRAQLSEAQIDALLAEDVDLAVADARAVVEVFDELDQARQAVLVDMAFNLGRTRLLGFRRMRAALVARDFERAADEMVASAWYRQVRSRGVRNVEVMRSGRWPAGFCDVP